MVGGIAQIVNYFALTDSQRLQLINLHEMHVSLHERLNLISRGDISHLWTRHILHSLTIAKYLPGTRGATCLDIGTGGGFPALPLAILLPEVQFMAIDGTQKKIRAVQEMVEALALENVTLEAVRAEDLTGSYDYVLARAVAPLANLLKWSKPLLKTGGKAIFLKGGDLSMEIKAVSGQWNIRSHTLSAEFSEPFFAEKHLLEIRLQGRKSH